MERLTRAFRKPAFASITLSVGVFVLIAVARESGLLQSAELFFYDKFLAWRSQPARVDERITLVEITENDIGKYDFPIPDHLLAKLLLTIEKGKPIAIGLDLYRDLPVPRDSSQIAELNQVLQANDNIVGIFGFGDREHPVRIPYPPVLADMPGRFGFNDFPFELGAVRRGFLFLSDEKDTAYPSFALALLAQAGVECQQKGSEFMVGRTAFPRFRSNDGGYIRADDGGHQFLLDFKSPRQFVAHSLDDVLSGKVDERSWGNKIVLIGEAAESAHDFVTTPLQTSLLGVELNAQILSQLLRAADGSDKVTRSWSEPLELGWTFIWCMAGGMTGFFFRRPITSLVICAFLILTLSGVCWIAFTHDLWLPLVPPLGGSLATATAVIGYTRYQERKDRQTMMRLFSQHLSSLIAEVMWEHRDEFMDGNRPRPQKLFATVLFTDFRNFSTVAEKLEPHQVMEWVNDYLQSLAQHVETQGGFVNKYIGDAIMAVFGYPIALTAQANPRADASNAVSCALGMRTEIERLNIEWQKIERSPIQMRVGIFSGPVVAGCVGSKDRLEFTVMGDTVNTAARLESFDKEFAADDPCRILIGQPTYELLDGQFPTEFVQSIELKGKQDKTTIYRVLGDRL